jgi:hypothetical protein
MTAKALMRLLKGGTSKRPKVWEGKSRSGGSLFVIANRLKISITWRDRRGLKEGWLHKTVTWHKLEKTLEGILIL